MRHYRDEPVEAVLEGRSATICAACKATTAAGLCFRTAPSTSAPASRPISRSKMIGDSVDAPHMARARAAILEHGGAARSNVFTRALLALYGEIPWRGVPVMAGRDHAAAQMVSVPSRQNVLLGAHGSRAAAGANGEKAAREESAWRAYRRTVRHAARRGASVAQGRTSDFSLDGDIRRGRQAAACRRAFLPQIDARALDGPRRKLDDRTTQRGRWPRRDLSRPWSTAC